MIADGFVKASLGKIRVLAAKKGHLRCIPMQEVVHQPLLAALDLYIPPHSNNQCCNNLLPILSANSNFGWLLVSGY